MVSFTRSFSKIMKLNLGIMSILYWPSAVMVYQYSRSLLSAPGHFSIQSMNFHLVWEQNISCCQPYCSVRKGQTVIHTYHHLSKNAIIFSVMGLNGSAQMVQVQMVSVVDQRCFLWLQCVTQLRDPWSKILNNLMENFDSYLVTYCIITHMPIFLVLQYQ